MPNWIRKQPQVSKAPDIGPAPEPKRFLEFEDYARLSARVEELKQRKRDAERRAVELANDLARKPDVARISEQLLHGEQVPADILDQQRRQSLRAEQERFTAEARVLGEAITRGESELEHLRAKLAPAAVEPLAGWYKDMALSMASHAVELLRLARLEREALDRLQAEGISTGALAPRGPMRPVWPGDDASYNSPLAGWLRELVAAGFIPEGDPILNGTGIGRADEIARQRHNDTMRLLAAAAG